MNTFPKYSVVEFPKEGSVEVIPSNWLLEGEKECWWPPKQTPYISFIQLLRDPSSTPLKNWDIVPCKILGQSGK